MGGRIKNFFTHRVDDDKEEKMSARVMNLFINHVGDDKKYIFEV